MANSKESRLLVIDSSGVVINSGETLDITGWNIYASNATWSITLKTSAGITIFQSGNNSPTPVLCKPISAIAGINCTAISNCVMRIYYSS